MLQQGICSPSEAFSNSSGGLEWLRMTYRLTWSFMVLLPITHMNIPTQIWLHESHHRAQHCFFRIRSKVRTDKFFSYTLWNEYFFITVCVKFTFFIPQDDLVFTVEVFSYRKIVYFLAHFHQLVSVHLLWIKASPIFHLVSWHTVVLWRNAGRVPQMKPRQTDTL